MTHHPRRPGRKANRRPGDPPRRRIILGWDGSRSDPAADVIAWVEAYAGDVTLTADQRRMIDQVFTAPAGTPPPGGWRSVGRTDQGPTFSAADIAAAYDALVDDLTAVAAIASTPRTLTLTTTLTPAGRAFFRGLGDNITGRIHHDDLHPDNRLEWLRVVEGRGPNGNPLVVCDHCGEPVPCVEEVLRHMDTDSHHTFCRPTGRCYVAERPIEELPTR